MKQLELKVAYVLGVIVGLICYIILPALCNIVLFPVYLIKKLDTYLWFKKIGNKELEKYGA